MLLITIYKKVNIEKAYAKRFQELKHNIPSRYMGVFLYVYPDYNSNKGVNRVRNFIKGNVVDMDLMDKFEEIFLRNQ